MSKETSKHSVDAVLHGGAEFLARKGVDQPRIACEWLLSRLLNRSRLSLHLIGEQILEERYLEAMRRGLRRVAAGEPIQYVTGQTEFMGHVFKTDRRALVPRPETEGLVRAVLACVPLWQNETPIILDLGTGTGCIVISLALEKPSSRYIGLDISSDAIALARENSQALGVADRVALSEGDIADVIEPEMLDALIANLPYIPTSVWETLPSHIRDHEPRLALDGGPAGLTAIEQAIQDATFALKPQGHLFLEIGYDQGDRVKTLLQETGFSETTVLPDLAGKDRVVSAVWAG